MALGTLCLNPTRGDARDCLVTSQGPRCSASPTHPQFAKLFSWDPDEAEALPPEPPLPDVDTDPDPYRHGIGAILAKQREGPEKGDPTLPWIMKHLKPLKAAGPYGDRYRHYKSHAAGLRTRPRSNMALSGRISDGARFQWQCGVLHAGDKQRRTPEGYNAARLIVAGSTLRQIVGCIPCAQLKFEFAKIFAAVRASGSAIPAGTVPFYGSAPVAAPTGCRAQISWGN